MAVNQLLVNNFRNLDNSHTDFHPDLNFIVGDNGSGKSSLLEALFFLAHGKSFRTNRSENLITANTNSFVISVKTNNDRRLGVERNVSHVSNIKIDGQFVNKFSILAQNIAVQIVTPESFKLFFGGPKERRRFIDLGLFHVKPKFQSLWKQFNSIHKQRNACLKQGIRNDQSQYWTNQFITASEHIALVRREYITELNQELAAWLKILLPCHFNNLTITYLQGWSAQKKLEQVLCDNIDREYIRGFSMYGCHKFDVKFTVDKLSIEEVFSRGQQKLFLLALTFAQAQLIKKVNRVKPIILIDDIGAELDLTSRKAFAEAYLHLDSQTFITAIDKSALEPLVPDDNNYKMFHVEHGQISAIGE